MSHVTSHMSHILSQPLLWSQWLWYAVQSPKCISKRSPDNYFGIIASLHWSHQYNKEAGGWHNFIRGWGVGWVTVIVVKITTYRVGATNSSWSKKAGGFCGTATHRVVFCMAFGGPHCTSNMLFNKITTSNVLVTYPVVSLSDWGSVCRYPQPCYRCCLDHQLYWSVTVARLLPGSMCPTVRQSKHHPAKMSMSYL